MVRGGDGGALLPGWRAWFAGVTPKVGPPGWRRSDVAGVTSKQEAPLPVCGCGLEWAPLCSAVPDITGAGLGETA